MLILPKYEHLLVSTHLHITHVFIILTPASGTVPIAPANPLLTGVPFVSGLP